MPQNTHPERVNLRIFRTFCIKNGLISCCFALFVTRLRVRIRVRCAVIANVQAYAFNRTLIFPGIEQLDLDAANVAKIPCDKR